MAEPPNSVWLSRLAGGRGRLVFLEVDQKVVQDGLIQVWPWATVDNRLPGVADQAPGPVRRRCRVYQEHQWAVGPRVRDQKWIVPLDVLVVDVAQEVPQHVGGKLDMSVVKFS